MNINWNQVKNDFMTTLALTADYKIPTPEEFEKLKLNILTYGQIKSLYKDKIDLGYSVYAHGEGRYEKLSNLAMELGFLEDTRDIPEYMKSSNSDYTKIILEAINKREITTEFLESLTKFNFLAGRYLELIDFDNVSNKRFEEAVSGFQKAKDIQKHWYAH